MYIYFNIMLILLTTSKWQSKNKTLNNQTHLYMELHILGCRNTQVRIYNL